MRRTLPLPLLMPILALLFTTPALAGTASAGREQPTLTLAVAANFRSTMEHLLAGMTATAGNGDNSAEQFRIVSGATGTLFAQITQGAPFDVFFAADAERPAQLLAQGHARAGSLQHYANGILALAYRNRTGQPTRHCDGMIDSAGELGEILAYYANAASTGGTLVSTANPRIAPYGMAASEVLERLEDTRDQAPGRTRRITARNVLQAQQFLETGHVELALVAYSLAADSARDDIVFCPFAATMHAPIVQALVVIDRPRSDAQQALLSQLLAFLSSTQASDAMSALGYRPVTPRNR